MNSTEVHQIKETAQQVHNMLGNALVSLRFIEANFEAFPPERRATLEAEWQRMHWQAIEDLCTSLALFKRQ